MKHYYLIGIKGVGMTALAKYLVEAGFKVDGSDIVDTFVTDEILKNTNINVYTPFDPSNLQKQKPDCVIVSAAYGEDNLEVKEAKRQGLKIVYYSEAIGEITREKKLIAIAGIHGKTTTTAMIASLLDEAGLDPSYIIGAAQIPVLGASGHFGKSENFVVEADEYRKSPNSLESKFFDLAPQYAIITSIELDHPDVFPSVEEVFAAFRRFASKVSRNGKIIINIDYLKAKKLIQTLADRNFETYGFSSGANWQAVNIEEQNETKFSVLHNGNLVGSFALGMPGKHNILNALATIIIGAEYQIDQEIIKKVLAEFGGVQRRFEMIDQVGDIVVIDDYAHHPTAIEKTLDAVKGKYPNKKVWCIFQPHTFSRTKSLLKEFGQAFQRADKVIIVDIYASAREKIGQISSLDLVNEIKKYQNNVYYMNNMEKVEKYIKNFAEGQLVIMTVGAGDIYKFGKRIPQILNERNHG